MSRRGKAVACAMFLLVAIPSARAQEPKGPPPALVAVSEVREGQVAPTVEFVGTIYYREVSEVASEVSGRVEEVRVEDGRRVRGGDLLVRIDSALLEKSVASTRAAHGQVLAELEKARRDLGRVETLYRQDAIAEQVYDENRFRAMSLEKRAESLEADLGRLTIELSKTEIRAPFGGVVVRKRVDRGEWLSPGTAVATLARDDTVDAVVEVPGEVVRRLSVGMTLNLRAAGKRMAGKVTAIVPRGDIATRTFPVKVRVVNRHALIEGMEARVEVPTGEKTTSLLVPRDALVTAMGQSVVFTVAESQARMIPVKVTFYDGDRAAVEGEGLRKGMPVIVKGNERVRDGQPVVVSSGGKEEAPPGGPPAKPGG
jgi:RND family efflux transporter MFP subunit